MKSCSRVHRDVDRASELAEHLHGHLDMGRATVLLSSNSGHGICIAILPVSAAQPVSSHISSTMCGANGLSISISISRSPFVRPFA